MTTLFIGDCRENLRRLPDESVHCCVTSPPYFGLRDYGVAGQIGLEKTPHEYVAMLVGVFQEVRRVLRSDGTLWLNLGDSYAGSWGNQGRKETRGTQRPINGDMMQPVLDGRYPSNGTKTGALENTPGLKNKDLIGIPWRVAFALQADGWWLRNDIIWHKPNPMPESVTDRCTRAHEYLFHFSKSAKYYYDIDAIKEPMSVSSVARLSQDVENQEGSSSRANGGAKTNGTMKAVGHIEKQRGHGRRHDGFNERWDQMERDQQCSGMRNRRTVWTIAPANFKGAHFATFPAKLIEPCVLAGCPMGGPFWTRSLGAAPPERSRIRSGDPLFCSN